MLVSVVILAAAMSGVVSIAVVVVSYYLTKRKEREADWNKIKLEYNREYISAVAGIVEGRATAETPVKVHGRIQYDRTRSIEGCS
jgi:hypothetical protein